MKTKKIEEYFNLLDSDKDGEISAAKIEISNLPIFVLEKIAPLLCEMEQMNLTLDFYNFSLAFSKLANVTNFLLNFFLSFFFLKFFVNFFWLQNRNGLKKKRISRIFHLK